MTRPASTDEGQELVKRFVQLSLSDTRMDQKGAWFNGDSLNPLPARCLTCGFPDLDFVSQPYFILRAPSMTPAEIGASNYGYLLVKDRMKRIVEYLLPDQCRFFPTTYLKTTEVTPWWLMIPVHFCRTGVVHSKIKRCSICGEPASAHGSEYETGNYYIVESPEKLSGEIYKTTNWWSAEGRSGGPKSWIHRGTFVSLRFYRLLKELKVVSLYQDGGETKPNSDEMNWFKDQVRRLAEAGVPTLPPGVSDSESKKWFRRFLKQNAGVQTALSEVGELEKVHKIRFPKAYLEFIEKVGSKRFEDIDSEEGLSAEILLPGECDFERFRKGRQDFEDEESREVDGLVFALTDFGDCFCFDLKKDRKEPSVVVYRHEEESFEPYSENFIECLKRFAAAEQDED